MKSRIPAFENSLVCLQHPLTILSIALLLINDHVLKIYFPSWLTGKLSDFAGLFFFPFIVAAGLGFLLFKSNISQRLIGQFAFSIAAIWFLLLKTIPVANSLTSQFASSLIGSPSQFILDPTDLIALVALLPAWALWRMPKPKMKLNIMAYTALSIGVLASIATSPAAWAIGNVTNLEYYKDGIVYAGEKGRMGNDNWYPIAISMDGGKTWNLTYDVQNIEEKSRPIKQCGHINNNICYRITKQRRLQESVDNGETWTEVTFGHTTYSNDMVFFDLEGKEIIIVAINEEGIMRRELPDGKWEKISLFDINNLK
jgi:hypothetical protein